MKNIYIKHLLLILVMMATIFILAGGFLAQADDEADEGEGDFQESVVKEVKPSTTSTKVRQESASTSVETKTTILNDSDGDGILDKDDSHPSVPEIYIVEDSNKNGIVDKFEK
jgi:hypothetical protein